MYQKAFLIKCVSFFSSNMFRSYENPLKPDKYRIEQASRSSYNTISRALKGKSTSPVKVQITLTYKDGFGKERVFNPIILVIICMTKKTLVISIYRKHGGVTSIAMARAEQ